MHAFAIVVACAAALPVLALKSEFLSHAGGKPSGSIAAAAVKATDIGFADVDAALKKDGNLTVNEFATFCTSNGAPWSMCKSVFKAADANKDQVVTDEEWGKLTPGQKSKVHSTWSVINFNHDQVISKKEWDSYCNAWMNPRPTMAQCNNIFKDADKDGNRELDKAEFSSAGSASKLGEKADKKGAKKGVKDVGWAEGKLSEKKKEQMSWACMWVALVLLVSCCCITPGSQAMDMQSHKSSQSEQTATGLRVGAQVLSVLGCLIPFIAGIYLFSSGIVSAFWDGGFEAVGWGCGLLCIWAILACCVGACQLVLLALVVMGYVAGTLNMGHVPSSSGRAEAPATSHRVKEVDQEWPDRVRQQYTQPGAPAFAPRGDPAGDPSSLVRPIRQQAGKQDAPFPVTRSLRGVPSASVSLDNRPKHGAPVMTRSMPSYTQAPPPGQDYSGAGEPHDVGMPVPTRPTLDAGAGAGRDASPAPDTGYVIVDDAGAGRRGYGE